MDRLELLARQRVGGGQDVVADPALALAAEREADLRQRGQVTGAERAQLAHERRHARGQGVLERVEQRLPHAGAAGAELVGAHRHRRAHDLHGQRRAAAARVALQQPPLVVAGVLAAARLGPERADARGHAVEQVAAREQVADQALGRGVAVARAVAHARPRPPARDRDHVRGRQALAIQDDGCGHQGVLPQGRARNTVAGVVELTGTGLSSHDVVAVARHGERVSLAAEARAAMQAGADVVARLVESPEPAYGISTGFGSLANVVIEPGPARPSSRAP